MKKEVFEISPENMTGSCSKCGNNFWKGSHDDFRELLDLIQLRHGFYCADCTKVGPGNE